jgi:hypothetical protein
MKLFETGLVKICPRCGRHGEVKLNGETPTPSFEIFWEPRDTPRHGNHRADPARRDNYDLADLVRPNFGCGYDDHQQRRSA